MVTVSMLWSLAKKIGRLALYGWNKQLRTCEASFVDEVLLRVDEWDRKALLAQLEQRERLQRWNSDRMVLFGFGEKAALPRIGDQSENHCIAKARLKGTITSVSVALMSHKGLLSSIEFSKSPRALEGAGVTVEALKLAPAHAGYAVNVDAEEHHVGRRE